MHIPSWPQAGEREAELLRQVLDSPQWGGFHPFVAQFEQQFAAWQQCPFGISTFNGTVSLELMLNVLGIGPGDEVIVPAISFISTATAVSRAGATPVFVDIDPHSLNIDPQQVSAALSPRTRAVLAVHFGGALCDVDALMSICAERGIALLEDAAHAHGSEWQGRRAGTFGLAASFSFQNGKVLSSGEGGLITTQDAEFAAQARSIANCGRVPKQSFYHHPNLGTNFRMSAFQAAVLLAQLERLPAQIARRTANAALLKSHTREMAAIRWQHELPETTQNSFYLLPARTSNRRTRDGICESLAAAGVAATPFYPHPLYANELYRNGNCRVLPCPVAEACVEDAFWLPHRVLLAEPPVMQQIAELLAASVASSRTARATSAVPSL